MEKSGAHRCALPAKFKPGNSDFDRSPPAYTPLYGAVGGVMDAQKVDAMQSVDV